MNKEIIKDKVLVELNKLDGILNVADTIVDIEDTIFCFNVFIGLSGGGMVDGYGLKFVILHSTHISDVTKDIQMKMCDGITNIINWRLNKQLQKDK